ncbi:MAG TPA: hypothetical protein VMY59_08055, partial [Candidatus Thermoplasmatota archaeon]|nr:hypothetical protein [Candidatus Thermoplasmatota archaeon]
MKKNNKKINFFNILGRSFVGKIAVFALAMIFICTAFSAAKIQIQDTTATQKNEDRGIVWDATLYFSETYGFNDNIIFGEAFDASDGYDIYDAPDPGGPPTPPYINSYFTTPFPSPNNKLMQEIKHYSTSNTYK